MATRLEDIDEWREITIPGSRPPVLLHRLHHDELTGASVSLVRFPAGWSRPGVGSYQAAEEFVVLGGSLEVGRHFAAGDYAFLPPRAQRRDSLSAGSALVLAWFSAAPVWTPDPAPVAGEPGVVAGVVAGVSSGHGVLRSPTSEVPGDYRVVSGAVEGGRHGRDVLSPADATWEWIPPGERGTLDASVLHVRTWG